MKKLFAAVLILLVTVGLFAQVAPYGSIAVNLGAQTTITDGDSRSSWIANVLTKDTYIGLRYNGDNISAFVQYQGNNVWNALGTWKKDALAVSAGYTFLPSTFWSGLAFNGNGNYGMGATVIGTVPLAKVEIAGFQAGIGGYIEGKDSFTPILFAAYDYNAETFSIGATLTGWASNLDSPDSAFPLLATVRGRYRAGALSFSGNLGVYMGAPTLVKIYPDDDDVAVATVPVTFKAVDLPSWKRVNGEDSVLLEGYIGVGYQINGALSAVLTLGYVHELAAEEDGGGDNFLQAGVAVPIAVGGGFTLTPGVIYQNKLSSTTFPQSLPPAIVDTKTSVLQYGVMLKYNF